MCHKLKHERCDIRMALIRKPQKTNFDTNKLHLGECSIVAGRNDVTLIFRDGKSLSFKQLLDRIEALETAYMEDKLLGVKSDNSGKIE